LLDVSDSQRLGLAYDLSESLLEDDGIDRSENLDVLTNVVGRARRCDLLRKPNSKLGAGQWQHIVALSADRIKLLHAIGNAIERRRTNNLIHGHTPLCAEFGVRFPRQYLKFNKAAFGDTASTTGYATRMRVARLRRDPPDG